MLLLALVYGRRIALFVPHGDLPRLRALSFFPWLIGTPILVALAVLWLVMSRVDLDGGTVFAVVFAMVALGVWAPTAMPFTVTVPAPRAGSDPIIVAGFPVVGVVVLVGLVVTEFALTVGLRLG